MGHIIDRHLAWGVCLIGVAAFCAAPTRGAMLFSDSFASQASDTPSAGFYSSTKLQIGGSLAAGGLGAQGPAASPHQAGFSTPQVWSTSDATVRPMTVLSTGLAYPGLTTEPGAVYTIRTGAASGGSISNPVRLATAGALPGGSFTRWVEFLVLPNLTVAGGSIGGATDEKVSLVLSFDDTALTGNTDGSGVSKDLALKLSVNNSLQLTVSALKDPTLAGTTSANLNTVTIGSTLTEDAVNLVLARIVHESGPTPTDTVTTWLNPTLGVPVTLLGAGTDVSGNFMVTEMSAMRLIMGAGKNGTNTQELTFDEFRLGSDPTDVGLLVPEPASLALLALGSLALLKRQRIPGHRPARGRELHLG